MGRRAGRKKKNDIVDGKRRQSTNQEEQGRVGYIQNAEQNNSSIWSKLKNAKGI
jgi:hypothetical protein